MGVALAVAVLTAALPAALELEARPGHVEAGAASVDGEGVLLRLRFPEAKGKGTQVSLVASAGEVGPLRPVEGTDPREPPTEWTAHYRPPPQRYPQVVILHAAAALEGDVYTVPLVLPVHGRDTLKLRTKPHAKLTVTVAGRTFGPARADARGEVELTVLVPPGVDTAIVRSEDRLGNRTTRSLPLHPPPFPRAFAVVAHPSRSASWADRAPTVLEVIAVTRTGAPLPASEIHGVRAERGVVEALQVTRPGRALARYRAPRAVGDGLDALSVELRRASSARGGGKVVVLPGPPAEVEVALRPPEFVAGVHEHLAVEVQVRDAAGNVVPVPPDVQLDSEVGHIVLAPDGERRLVIPPSLAGKTQARLTVKVGTAEAVTDVPLRAGAPAMGRLALSKRMVRAGGSGAVGEILLADAHGNPVTGALLEVRLAANGAESRARVIEEGEGRYALALEAGARSAAGDAWVEVRPRQGELTLTQPVVVLPFQRDVGLSVGAWLSGHHNLGAVQGASPSVELALRPSQLPIEALLQAGLFRYAPARLPHAGGDEGVMRRIDVDRQQVAAGVRVSLPIGARLSLQASALGGASRTQTAITVEGLRDAAPEVAEAARWDPVVRGGAGVSVRLGPGRLMLEGRAGWAPSRGQVSGNFDGAGAAVGYLVEVR